MPAIQHFSHFCRPDGVAFEPFEVLKDLKYVCVRSQCLCETALSRPPALISGERKLMLINGAYKSD